MQTQTDSTDSPDKPSNPLSQLAQNMFSNNNNNINNSTIMLAAIVSLLLVILFVLLLHVYAKWLLVQSQPQHRRRRRRRRRRRAPATLSGVQGPPQFHHFRIEDSPFSTKGLDSATVLKIPTFVYEAEKTGEMGEEAEELECVICLSGFEEGEVGRSLPKCGHVFHVECIDMWLSSHCNCPICRAPIVCGGDGVQNDSQLGSVDGGGAGDGNDGDDDDHGVLEIVVGTPSYEISEFGNESGNDSFGASGVSGAGSVSETSLSLLGCSLKRMLSKVFVSSNVNNALDGSQ